MKTAIIVVVSLVIFLALAGSVGFVAIKGNLNKNNDLAVRLEYPQQKNLIEFTSAPGQIEPIKKVEIRSKISALIIELPYKIGDKITKGDPNAIPSIPASVLMRLDAKELQEEIKATQTRRDAQAARVEISKIRLNARRETLKGNKILFEQAERELQRSEALLKSGDVKLVDVEQERTTVANQRAQLAASEITLNADEQDLEVSKLDLAASDAGIAQKQEGLKFTTFTSPIDGIVTRVEAEVGEMATGSSYQPGTVILEVADLSQMMLVAQIDEADIGKIKVGQPANVHIQAWPDVIFKGRVSTTALSPTAAGGGGKYFEAEVLLDDQEQEIFSGMTADVDIQINTHENVLIVPRQAVLDREIDFLPPAIRDNSPEIDKSKLYAAVVYCYVDGEAILTPVTYGESDETHIIIRSGITEEDQIITGPFKVLEALRHKQKVVDEKELSEDEIVANRDVQEAAITEAEEAQRQRDQDR
ncbi:MAG: HlyD family efflux transporter periplasmic adaptor subunit [Planctomycetes bacterium]|nr:HlyD family efflux transporter periplasmic adaptor subunit [Planctomycetota bacterium]